MFKSLWRRLLSYISLAGILLYMCSIDDIYDKGYFAGATLVVLILLLLLRYTWKSGINNKDPQK